MNITVRTRSLHPRLYNKMRSLIPSEVNCFRDIGYSKWEDAVNFLHDSIENTKGLLLILDEDAFITDWKAVELLCSTVVDTNCTHSGVPDGGIISHRKHSYLHVNPFFIILNCDLINPLKKQFSRQEIDSTTYASTMNYLKPVWISGEFAHDNIEPFAGLFYWLALYGKPYFLKGVTLWDQISTKVIDPVNRNLTYCMHSWYSRQYDNDFHTQMRIDYLYDVARFNATQVNMGM